MGNCVHYSAYKLLVEPYIGALQRSGRRGGADKAWGKWYFRRIQINIEILYSLIDIGSLVKLKMAFRAVTFNLNA